MNIDFKKCNDMVPVIIQDYFTLKVLMLGYMNPEAYEKTTKEGIVTFYSRSKKRLWTKGEVSGNFLTVKNIMTDCDNDTILIQVDPAGPVCHTGSESCFGSESKKGFLYELENIINERFESNQEESYTNRLLRKGIDKVAQKVGEEAVELVIEAMGKSEEKFVNEAADLLYHFIVLLKAKGFRLEDIEEILDGRNKK